SQSIAFGFLRFWDSLNFKKDKEFVGITVLFLDENLSRKDCIDYCFWEEKDLAPEDCDNPVLLTIISHLPICFLCGISDLISPFQAEQQMEANFSGSFSTSRQIRRYILVGG
ncbi:hypothetical protein HID58_076917, partial [Brassica napus]